MNSNDDRQCFWASIGVKFALSLAALFPIYALLYLAYPVSIFAGYVLTAVLVTFFAPWDDIRKKFLS